MRRKSERTATKTNKPKSPEKKVEKLKRGRTKRRKQSESSENESAEESSPVREEVTSEIEKKLPQTPVKEDSPEEAHDQVWHVKAAKQSGDTGEIQKLKLCLTRPPSTPERVDRSPRSKRKHMRATSSTETPSVETEDKKKSKHRSKRSTRESKDETEKTDSQGDESEMKAEVSEQQVNEITQATEISEADETPMSTTNDESKTNMTLTVVTKLQEGNETSNAIKEAEIKSSHVDTTVTSPKAEGGDKQLEVNTSKKDSPLHTGSGLVNKSETQDMDIEKKEMEAEVEIQQNADTKDRSTNEEKEEASSSSSDKEVSKTEDQTQTDTSVTKEAEISQSKKVKDNNKTDVLENTDSQKRIDSTDSGKDLEGSNDKNERELKNFHTTKSQEMLNENYKNKQLEYSDSMQSAPEDTIHNGQPPIVINRKRRWGSRLSKGNSQKSITISTDVLKEIIPDVKPAEFDEVIEEKKHKRVEVIERVERPVLPKIVIDNTEHVEQNRRDYEDKDTENLKAKESNLASNRRISIVKDNDNLITRPPSPPRHKQSCILYITNLVRPFTLPQLKNLLQRTGRIVEDGFWIDKIKSKCYVKYETEDQAVETRHALHGVTWPVSNPKMLQVDFSTQEAFDKAKADEETDSAQVSAIPGTVEDWLREQDLKRERGELERPWDRKTSIREWDMGKNEKDKEKLRRNDRTLDKRRHHTPEKSPEPARKFKKKEEEAPAKLLDDLFRKTKTTPCIYWLPLSAETFHLMASDDETEDVRTDLGEGGLALLRTAETQNHNKHNCSAADFSKRVVTIQIAIKEEQRRKHMAEHERRMQEMRRTHRRH